jgi:hypothetical protein
MISPSKVSEYQHGAQRSMIKTNTEEIITNDDLNENKR